MPSLSCSRASLRYTAIFIAIIIMLTPIPMLVVVISIVSVMWFLAGSLPGVTSVFVVSI